MQVRVGQKITTAMRGFTIVELLIVVVVIAILAAISLVAYNGVTSNAYDSSVQADLSSLGKKVEQYKIENNNTVPTSIPGVVDGAKASRNSYGVHYVPTAGHEYNLLYCRDMTTYGFIAGSKSGKVFVLKNGKVQVGVGPLTTWTTTCGNNGLPTAGSWLYNDNTWTI